MGHVAVAVDIDAPPDVVWRVIEPIERHVEWMADAEAIRFEASQTGEVQTRGVGTRFACDTRLGPLRLTDHMTITEWTPGEVMGVAHDGAVSGTGRFTLAPLAGGRTRFSWDEELRFPWWLGGRLGEAVGGRLVLRAIWRRNLRRLAALASAPSALFVPPTPPTQSGNP